MMAAPAMTPFQPYGIMGLRLARLTCRTPRKMNSRMTAILTSDDDVVDLGALPDADVEDPGDEQGDDDGREVDDRRRTRTSLRTDRG
ncbi:MAG: hypothetical protein MZV70_29520 [Desulfobacterales bacterium]|nr:hypothetical protein [Desulfobacterales bacterium]